MQLRGLPPEQLRHGKPELMDRSQQRFTEQLFPTLQELECDHIRKVLRHVDDNKTRAAEILGIDRVSLWRKLKKLGLSP